MTLINCWFDLKEYLKGKGELLYEIALSNIDEVILEKKEYLMLKKSELYSGLGNYIYMIYMKRLMEKYLF